MIDIHLKISPLQPVEFSGEHGANGEDRGQPVSPAMC